MLTAAPMPTKKGANGAGADAQGNASPPERRHDGETMRTVAWVALLERAIDKLGIPLVLFVICLGVIKTFGSAKTQDDFVREMLFGDITHGPWIRLFFFGLIILCLLWSRITKRRASRESPEMKRIADEKSRLQEELIGKKLSHTQEKQED